MKFLFFVLLIPTILFAQANNILQTDVGNSSSSFLPKDMTLSTSLGFDSNLYTDKYDSFQNINAQALIGYKLNDEYSLQLRLAYDKGITGARESLMQDSRLTVMKKPITLIKDTLILAPSISGIIPINKLSTEDSRLKTALEVNSALVLNITKYLSFTYIPRVRKNFHEFTTNNNGEQLTDFSLINIALLSWSVAEKISLTTGLFYVEAWQYDSIRRAPVYLSLIEAGYMLDRKNNLAIGLSTEGQVIDNERAEDETISFYDQNKSSLYINYNHIF